MESFLSSSKNRLTNWGCSRTGDSPRIRAYLGNPSCDLDSAVCALAQAYLEYQIARDGSSDGRREPDHVFLPVLNVKRNEFRTKTEVRHHLRECNVDVDSLTFRDEVDLQRIHEQGKLDLSLLDHHALTGDDSGLRGSVRSVIDHRPQDRDWPWLDCDLVLEQVGSCASLVARNVLRRRPSSMSELGKLLLGPILIDTANFSKEADRARPLDREMAEEIEKICCFSASERRQLYEQILKAKTDISELTPDDLLIRDLKVVNGVSIPGFPILVRDFLQLKGASEALRAFCEARNCHTVVLIGMELKEERLTRDIGVYSLDADRAANKLIEALKSSTEPKLELTEVKRNEQDEHQRQETRGSSSISSGGGELDGKFLALYTQANVRASRKQILPIIQKATASSSSTHS
ncbi:exopolyphosphatase PRUNE1 isoform X1 [Trichogramma pretiosum]|uniref:exopolyphosphatase PRUNE1 isoform X1 n=1 Tax=Trichogramma pretiosum TaxID=7493 RepID=UPI0006C9AB98|nr:exopolyphosphatase PRUNE1 isoform X1 [Trichogramma pretiosum]